MIEINPDGAARHQGWHHPITTNQKNKNHAISAWRANDSISFD
ncbi:hypothetical protein [Allofranklinella schreckenbergeri]|nr:hypothetical protein [Allofranklinella schreckenbergeri]